MTIESAESAQERRKRQFGVTLEALAAAMARMDKHGLSELERAGAVQFFELSWDLAWKVLRDDVIERGVTLDFVAPNSVIRAAAGAGMIADPDGWVEAGRARNLLTHTYDSEHVDRALRHVRDRFLPLLQSYYAHGAGG